MATLVVFIKNKTSMLMAVVLFVFYITSCSSDIPQKINVDIMNDLGAGFNMTIHCKSKNDDLGVHVVPPNGDWQFNFKTSFWGNTQFFCSVEWPGTSHYFDAFIERREFGVCTTCVWSIKPEQPCLVFKDKNICYAWT